MESISIQTWAGFSKAIGELRNEYKGRELASGRRIGGDVYFRGQSNQEWRLQTTLERATDNIYTVEGYANEVLGICRELESFTDSEWNYPNWPDIENELAENQNHFRVHLPGYPLMVHLRHLGFPSPLLDWTQSPYIAAYFALIDAEKTDAAVYCYIERPNATKSISGDRPRISVMGPHVKTHKRHFAQKARYSIATTWDDKASKHSFCSHHSVFDTNRVDQDVLVRIVIPNQLRMEALRQLNDYNINHYTLFGTEESLAKTFSTRIFDLRGY